MNKSELKELIKNTDFFYEDCKLIKMRETTITELKSILTYELQNKSKEELYGLVSELIDSCKEEILDQDKRVCRTIVSEIDPKWVRHITEHRHPVGTFITRLGKYEYMMINTFAGLDTKYYHSKNEMLAQLILEKCFNIFYDPNENVIQIQTLRTTMETMFSRDILKYIKRNADGITSEILSHELFRKFKDADREELFKEYMKFNLRNIFEDSEQKYPSYIQIGDKIKTRLSDEATVIDIDPISKTMKLDKEVQNDITIFTDTINYENKDFIVEIASPNVDEQEMEAS